ncbi:hypothetical protein [Legionella sp. W05-934-2]|uniref:hypothetical protein n=1 Tax=Legionella sp. W05-934-2 TaxID=1198649 RepID=UPI003463703E
MGNENAKALEVSQIDDDSATVYVWSGGLNGLGHVSIQLNNGSDNYLSIWPKSTPAGGFTSVVPLQATFAKKLDDDCRQEAIRPFSDFSNLLEPDKIVPEQPDKVFVVHGLDKKKMEDELDRIEKEVEEGNLRYQLLPGVKLPSFIYPYITGKTQSVEVHNCVTLTEHLLVTGGKTDLAKNPWATPSQFAANLNSQDNVERINLATGEVEKKESKESYWGFFSSIFSNRNTSNGMGNVSSDNHSYRDDSSNYTYGDDSSDITPISQEKAPEMAETSSSSISESSCAFFDQPKEESTSFLQQRESESDTNYLQRMDALAN